MSLVHRSRKHHHHHSPNKIEKLSASFHQSISKIEKLEEEIARLGEQHNPPAPVAEEKYFWPKR